MDAKQFESFMQYNHECWRKQQEMFKGMLEGNSKANISSATIKPSTEQLMETLSNSIATFTYYDPDNSLTFNEWYNRHEDIFIVDGKELDAASRVRLLLRKLDSISHNRYINLILPKKARDFSFDDTVKELTAIFGTKTSLFATRYNCMKLEKDPNNDFLSYAGLVNKSVENFKLSTISIDQFKCLMFVCRLKQSRDAEIRTKLLTKIEANADLTLKNFGNRM